MSSVGASTWWRDRSLAIGGVALVALLCAGALGLALKRSAITLSEVELRLDPLRIESLYEPLDQQRDLAADLEGQVERAMGADLDSLVEAETGRPVSIMAFAGSVERGEIVDGVWSGDEGTIVLVVDAGDAAASYEAAQAAAAAFLQMRADGGIAAGESGLEAVTLNLASLQEDRAQAIDADQLGAIDQAISDNQASLRQLQEGIARLQDQPNGTAGTPSDPATGLRYLRAAAVTFGVLLLVGTLGVWLVDRWSGPVRRRRGLAGGGALTVVDEDDLPALALGVRLGAEPDRGTLLVVLGASGSRDAARFAARVARAAAAEHTTVLVGVLPEGGLELSELLDAGVVPSIPVGAPLVVGFGGTSADPAGTIATRRTARSFDLLRAVAEVVVVAGPVATSLAASAWSTHAQELVLVVVEGRTSQGDVRRALAALERFGVQVRVLLVPPGLVTDGPRASVELPSPV